MTFFVIIRLICNWFDGVSYGILPVPLARPRHCYSVWVVLTTGDYKHRKGPQVTAKDLENTTRDHRGSQETTGNLDEMDETIVWDSVNLRQFAFY